MTQNYINHIAVVIDSSGSMWNRGDDVLKVVDSQIAYLAQRSKELDQETRITLYTFDTRTKCIVYDKDVLRMPSLRGLYRPDGQTALIDATLQTIVDLKQTPELYGEHAFLIYVVTDGAENASRSKASALTTAIDKLADNWTLACFVPNAIGVSEAKKFGFPKDNIAIWDATSAKGVEEAGARMRSTSESFMTARSKGIRGYKNLFSLDVDKLSKTAVHKLDKLGPGQFRRSQVGIDGRIDQFVEALTKRPYRLGEAFYQLTKPVDVQPQKVVALYEKKTHSVYTGAQARTLLGLPDYTVKVSPSAHPDFDIFIQSTSMNRKLFGGTYVLVLPQR